MAKVSALCPRTSRARTLLQPPDTYRHTVLLLLLLQGGRARAFGGKGHGRCTAPVDVQGKVLAAAAGPRHTVLLLQGGRVRAVGNNDSGQCTVPEDVQGNVLAAAAEVSHTVLLLRRAAAPAPSATITMVSALCPRTSRAMSALAVA